MEKHDYYVYVHERLDNGVVFYIGHGRGRRAFNKGRTKTSEWGLVDKEAGGHCVSYLFTNLTKSHAEFIEEYYIKNTPSAWNIVNKRLPVKELKLDFNELSNLFAYSESSPSGLIWIGSKHQSRNGQPAGSIQKTGNKKLYWVVRVGKRLFLAHRVVYVLLTGIPIPSNLVIDHIDGDGLNNNRENLRLTTPIKNSMNSVKKVGITGEKHIRISENNVTLVIDNESYGRKYMKFAIRKYGYEKALAMAVASRDDFLSRKESLWN